MDGAGTKAAGYIDMVGAANNLTASNPDNIFGFETAPARNSGSEAVRRRNLTDTDNNSVDFIAARYGSGDRTLTDAELEVRRPRNASDGAWNPFASPAVAATYTVTQIGGTAGTVTTTGIQFTFISPIDSLNVTAADITVGGVAEKEDTAIFTKQGDNWVLSPIKVNQLGIATVSISKLGIETGTKNVSVYLQGAVEVEPGDEDPLAGQLLILQAYAPSSGPAGASHPFVELYNNTDDDIDLDGIVLFFANGDTGTTQDEDWRRIALTGEIPSKGSFLVMGPAAGNLTNTRYNFDQRHGPNYGDINDSSFTLSNNAFKIAIIRTDFANALNVQNPFTMDLAGANAKTAEGYIDMVGAHNAANRTINGFETAPARCSASEAVRRNSLIDSNNNRGISELYPNGTGDFDSVRYAAGGMTDQLLAVRHPRNSAAGAWNPFAEPEAPPVPNGATIAAWNYDATMGGGNSDMQANSGALVAGATLNFFYGDGTKATDLRASNAGPINVPNNASGWWNRTAIPDAATVANTNPALGEITVENSAGWVITLNTTGFKNITFSAGQSSSNNGPSQFRLAYRIGTTGTWTVFGDNVIVTVEGTTTVPVGKTFTNVPLPETVWDKPEVQIRVWIASGRPRGTGTMGPANGNTSINNIVFNGDEISQ
jgi:hypothetical protein